MFIKLRAVGCALMVMHVDVFRRFMEVLSSVLLGDGVQTVIDL